MARRAGGGGSPPALTRGAAARTPLAHRTGRLLPDRVPEQAVEERLATAVPIVVVRARNPVRQSDRGPALARAGTRHRDLQLPAIAALQRGERLRVAAIDVFADLQVAGFVNERSLVGDVHRDRRIEPQIDLGVT